MEHVIAIGTVSRLARVKISMIRYYESVGLLPAPPRSEGNRRAFGMADVKRLMFIRHSRALGFGVDAVRQLLKLAGMPEEPCDEADAITREHLEAIRLKIDQLTALSAELKTMLDRGTHGTIAECRVIEALAGEDG